MIRKVGHVLLVALLSDEGVDVLVSMCDAGITKLSLAVVDMV